MEIRDADPARADSRAAAEYFLDLDIRGWPARAFEDRQHACHQGRATGIAR